MAKKTKLLTVLTTSGPIQCTFDPDTYIQFLDDWSDQQEARATDSEPKSLTMYYSGTYTCGSQAITGILNIRWSSVIGYITPEEKPVKVKDPAVLAGAQPRRDRE